MPEKREAGVEGASARAGRRGGPSSREDGVGGEGSPARASFFFIGTQGEVFRREGGGFEGRDEANVDR